MREKILEIVRANQGVEEVLLLNMLGSLQHRVFIDELVTSDVICRVREKGRGTRLYTTDTPKAQRIRERTQRRAKRTTAQIIAVENMAYRMFRLEQRIAELESLFKP